jgi:hypothetical protein
MPWEVSRADAVSYYDVSPLKATLERLVDFDRINAGGTRLSVGAVNVPRSCSIPARLPVSFARACRSIRPSRPSRRIGAQHRHPSGEADRTFLVVAADEPCA